MDYAGSAGLSVMAWLQSWFHLNPPRAIVTLVGMALFCWPLMQVERYRDFNFRLLFLCNVLIWVVIFNHKAESSTYVIAICGVALWLLRADEELDRPRAGLDGLHIYMPFADRRVPVVR